MKQLSQKRYPTIIILQATLDNGQVDDSVAWGGHNRKNMLKVVAEWWIFAIPRPLSAKSSLVHVLDKGNKRNIKQIIKPVQEIE